MFDWRDYGNGIYAFDAGYVRPILAAIHLIVDHGRVAFVDTGSKDSLPNARLALQKLGLDASAVDYVILQQARNFMTNTLNAFIGTMGASSLLQRISEAQTHEHLRELFDEWFHTLVNSREGRREAEALRGKLLQVI